MAKSRFSRLILASTLPIAMLAACGEEVAEEEEVIVDDGREASGEILPSSISDDMIATDGLRSQPPLLADEPAAQSGGAGNGAPAAAEIAEVVEAAPEAEPVSTSEPVPEPASEPVPLPED